MLISAKYTSPCGVLLAQAREGGEILRLQAFLKVLHVALPLVAVPSRDPRASSDAVRCLPRGSGSQLNTTTVALVSVAGPTASTTVEALRAGAPVVPRWTRFYEVRQLCVGGSGLEPRPPSFAKSSRLPNTPTHPGQKLHVGPRQLQWPPVERVETVPWLTPTQGYSGRVKLVTVDNQVRRWGTKSRITGR
jgi:hypothetical protein